VTGSDEAELEESSEHGAFIDVLWDQPACRPQACGLVDHERCFLRPFLDGCVLTFETTIVAGSRDLAIRVTSLPESQVSDPIATRSEEDLLSALRLRAEYEFPGQYVTEAIAALLATTHIDEFRLQNRLQIPLRWFSRKRKRPRFQSFF
jgi:hypothetical protein